MFFFFPSLKIRIQDMKIEQGNTYSEVNIPFIYLIREIFAEHFKIYYELWN